MALASPHRTPHLISRDKPLISTLLSELLKPDTDTAAEFAN